jgi:thymidylate synthase (FAD)
MPKWDEPSVFLIGGPQIYWPEVARYLDTLGVDGQRWVASKREGDSLEVLAEIMGRICYRSWEPGLNLNVTQVRAETSAYMANLIARRHFAIFDHCWINFVFHWVSRVFTHELVRHRVGVAIAQESMRYVRLDQIPVWMSDNLLEGVATGGLSDPVFELESDVNEVLGLMEAKQRKWVEYLQLPSANFEQKKIATSALRRYFSPTGIATEIGWSVDVSELRHVIEQRTSPEVEEEMQLMFGKVKELVVARWPTLFGDL